MMNKKGIELPVSMIVVLILSILLFAIGLVLVFKIYRGVTETSMVIDRETEAHIVQSLRAENDLVSLPRTVQRVKMGETVTFWVGLRNIVSDNRFVVKTVFDSAYGQNDQRMDNIISGDDWIGGVKEQTIVVPQDEFRIIPVVVKTSASIGGQPARKGTYVFNVCVFKENFVTDCLVGNKEVAYDKQVHQISVII